MDIDGIEGLRPKEKEVKAEGENDKQIDRQKNIKRQIIREEGRD